MAPILSRLSPGGGGGFGFGRRRKRRRFVSRPLITSPSAGSYVDCETFNVTSTAYIHVDSGLHATSQWQVASDASFTNIIENITSGSELTSYNPSFGPSHVDQPAYVRVRYTSLLGITSDWSPALLFNPQQYFLWRVSVSMGGGRGGNNGGWGGLGTWEMTTSTYSPSPPGYMNGIVGSSASGQNGVGGYSSGGTSTSCNDGSGGGGGGATMVRYNGSTMAVCGGGGGRGGGNGGGGGGGGGIGNAGSGGGGKGGNPGGSGGSASLSGGNGSSASSCGFHSGNPDRRFSGGSGGGGGGGGGAGRGNTQNDWEGGTGGGGGGGGWSTSPLSGSGYTVTAGPTATNGGATSGPHITIQLSASSRDSGGVFTNRQSHSGGNTIVLANLK